jgi:hypothetical protein
MYINKLKLKLNANTIHVREVGDLFDIHSIIVQTYLFVISKGKITISVSAMT